MKIRSQKTIPTNVQREFLTNAGLDPDKEMPAEMQHRLLASIEVMKKVAEFPKNELYALCRAYVAAGTREEVSEIPGFGNVNVSGLTALIAAIPEAFPSQKVPFSKFGSNGGDTLDRFLGKREIDESRVDSLTAERLEDPIIFLHTAKGSAILDGAHRLKARIKRGYTDVACIAVDESSARMWLYPPENTIVDDEGRAFLSFQLETMLALQTMAVTPFTPYQKRTA